jgi:hypothetical protein
MATLLIVTLFASLYLSEKSPTQTPNKKPTANPVLFDYHLDISPTNGSIMQGSIIQANVTITYIQGSPENVTLSSIGIPDGADSTFSQLQGLLTSNSTFNSTMTIHVSGATPSNIYNITVRATSDDGKMYSSVYKLSVINSKVSVSGSVTGEIDVVPTQIIFDQLSSKGTIEQTFAAPIQAGNYEINLPNKQFYAVRVTYEKSDGSQGTHNFVFPIGVDTGVDISSITCPFAW